ncbi:MAG: hypothetical protein J6Q48_02975 [Bacteroidaceae bacterium]|nr:hypothetical protein [Bacteroidaceae bacterium]
MTESIVKIILANIRIHCRNTDKDCTGCPFRISNPWAEYCMFSGPHAGEGIIPEDWELEKYVQNEKDIEE